MINKDQNICQGTFTRITPNSGTTILDYVLVSANAKQDITEMIIDEERDVLSTSDHVLVTVKVNLSGPIRMDNYFEPRIIMKHDRNKQLAKDIMDHYIESIDWESINMDEKCVNLQTILMDANMTAYGYSRQSESKRPKSVPSSLKRLRRRCKAATQLSNQLSLSKAKSIIDHMRPGTKRTKICWRKPSRQSNPFKLQSRKGPGKSSWHEHSG